MTTVSEKFSAPLVWLDMEMTGLDPERHHILEVAVIITDGDLNILHEGPHLVVYQDDATLAEMDEWCTQCHTQNGLVDQVKASTVSVADAEQALLAVLKQYCQPKLSPLCGNSIEQDRRFIVKYMPMLDSFLHYRHVNVSSFKEMVQRWYPNHPAKDFDKKKTHLALDDIRESIAELKHYRKHFFQHEA